MAGVVLGIVGIVLGGHPSQVTGRFGRAALVWACGEWDAWCVYHSRVRWMAGWLGCGRQEWVSFFVLQAREQLRVRIGPRQS